MKLSVVIPVLGQHELAKLCIAQVVKNKLYPDTEVIVIDQGGDLELEGERFKDVITFVPDHNLGVYPTFPFGMEASHGDVVLFIHSDLIITERSFDSRILVEFQRDPKLGLIGFVGSDEIDAAGGRGLGTTSNFQGGTYRSGDLEWTGSPARAHGRENAGLTRAAVVDGCAMAITRLAWAKIGYREDFPPHHFYDRLISCQVQEAGFRMGVLGIACDHISGQTVNKEQAYHDYAKEWCEKHLTPDQFAGNPPNYAWDETLYRAAERAWLGEYRDQKKFIPRKVMVI